MIRAILIAALISLPAFAAPQMTDPLGVAGDIPASPVAFDLSQLAGFAAVAGTTGGAGKPVYIVTRPTDDPEQPRWFNRVHLHAIGLPVEYFADCPASQSTLNFREALTCAALSDGGLIRFSVPEVAGVKTFNIPPNVTIDGQGASVTAPWRWNVVEIASNNVIVWGLRIHQSSLVYRYGHCLDVYNADRVWLAHNDFGYCGEGAVYVNQGRRLDASGLPKPMNVTVAFNAIHDIGKVFAIGQLECEPTFSPASSYRPPAWCLDATALQWADPVASTPFIHVTLQANLLDGVGERAPRVGAAYVDMVDNLIAYKHYTRPTTDGAHPDVPGTIPAPDGSTLAYGGVASGGAHLTGRGGYYVSLGGSDNAALCAPGVTDPRCHSGLTMQDGTVLAEHASVAIDGLLVSPPTAYAATHVAPENTPAPPYTLAPRLTGGAGAAAHCLARAVGPTGGALDCATGITGSLH